MELTSFVLGVCAVIMLIVVVGTFGNYRLINTLMKDNDQLQKDLVNSYSEMSKIESKLYRHIDSRVDKVNDILTREMTELKNK